MTGPRNYSDGDRCQCGHPCEPEYGPNEVCWNCWQRSMGGDGTVERPLTDEEFAEVERRLTDGANVDSKAAPLSAAVAGSSENTVAGLTVRGADLDRARPPRWAWRDRIVLGYLNLLLGNEGVGKGTMIAWLIARLTRGELPGNLHGRPVGVGVLGDEDSFDDVWTPRLHAAGAALSRVVQIERPDGGFVNVREDRDKLAAVSREHELAVLFFDQLLDNLGVGVDDWRQKAVRDALQPLRSLARELDIAALGCLHPNKRADSFRQLIAGAPAFNSVSRSSLLLAQHPDDENVRVLVRGKGNLSQTPQAVEFEIREHRFDANSVEFRVPLATGFNVGELTVDQLLDAENGRTLEHSNIAAACEIIDALLPRDGQWHPAKPIKKACAEEGIEDRLAKRGKERLKIEHRRTKTFPAATEWRWPSSHDTHGALAPAVPTVPTVPTANSPKPPRSSSWATQDSRDSENERPHCAPTSADADPDAELERIAAKWGDL